MTHHPIQYGVFFSGIPSISTATERARLAALDRALFIESVYSTLADQAVSELVRRGDSRVTTETLTDMLRINALAPDRLDRYEHIRHLIRGVAGYYQFMSLLSRELTNRGCGPMSVLVCARSMGILAALVVSGCITFDNGVYLAQVMGQIHRESYDAAPSRYVSRKLHFVTDEQLSRLCDCLSGFHDQGNLPLFVLEHDPDWSTLIQYSEEMNDLLECALTRLEIHRGRPSHFSSGAHTPLTWNWAHELQRILLEEIDVKPPTDSFLIHAQSAKQAPNVLFTAAEIRAEILQVTCGPMDLRPMFRTVSDLASHNQCFILVEIGSNTLAAQLESLKPSSAREIVRVYDPYHPADPWISGFVDCLGKTNSRCKL